jgi:putative glutamine transport system substrate-binding protein
MGIRGMQGIGRAGFPGKLVSCIAVIAATAVLTACGTSSGNRLKVGVRSKIPDFSYYYPESGQYYGMEIDLAKQLAADMGYDGVDFVSVSAEDREQKLADGEADCLIACYTITDERRQKFDLTPAYYTDHGVVLTEKSSLITDLKGLVGGTVGVVSGTSSGSELTAKMTADGLITAADPKGTKTVDYPSYDALAAALESGDVDAACMDGCIAFTYENGNVQRLKETVSDVDYGIATPKGSPLSSKIAGALEKRLEDGTMDALISKWN